METLYFSWKVIPVVETLNFQPKNHFRGTGHSLFTKDNFWTHWNFHESFSRVWGHLILDPKVWRAWKVSKHVSLCVGIKYFKKVFSGCGDIEIFEMLFPACWEIGYFRKNFLCVQTWSIFRWGEIEKLEKYFRMQGWNCWKMFQDVESSWSLGQKL